MPDPNQSFQAPPAAGPVTPAPDNKTHNSPAASRPPSKIIFKLPRFLGDQIIFSGALRALHESHPGRFITDVDQDTELFGNNPYITKLDRRDPDVKVFKKPVLGGFRKNKLTGKHCVEASTEKLADKLHVKISLNEKRGDLYLTSEEQNHPPPGLENVRYWIVVAGCKTNVPVKGWGTANYQSVVDALQGKVHFVQCGSEATWHPPLQGVTNRVAKTSVRDFIRLIYHADGLLCPITSAMHLLAAVPAKPGGPNPRTAVILAGGREPVPYIAYPGHVILANPGALPCSVMPCGYSKFSLKNGCQRPVKTGSQEIPECLSLIRPSEVVSAILRSIKQA